MASKIMLAKRHQHEQNNEGHKVHFSILWQCNSCAWLEYPHHSEYEIDRLLEAEYHAINEQRLYNLELDTIRSLI